MLIGDWQAWVDGDGHWKVRGPDPDDERHYADGDIELTEAEYTEAGNSQARKKIRARRAKEAARTYIKTMQTSKARHHATKKSPAQLQHEIDEALAPHQGRWDDSPGAWQRGYEFAQESALHETRAQQREILQRVAAGARSAYDHGFVAGYQDVLGVPRSDRGRLKRTK